MKSEKELKLKVMESVQDDVNKGITRIDSSQMRQIGAKPGDIIEIEGEQTTVALVDRAYPGDLGLNIIRMDGIIRRNAKTSIGEVVKVRKSEVKEAKKVIIAPARKGIVIRASPNTFKQGLLGRAVVKGDIVSLGGTTRRRSTMTGSPFDDIFRMLEEGSVNGGFGFGDLRFIVADTAPKGAVLISDTTEIVLNPEAVEIKEEVIPDVTYEDIGGLSEEIKKIREMVELPLKHPEIFERLGVEAPKGVLLHGPPGTGKTLLAKAVANESNSHFIVINGPEIMSKFYGQSEENLRKKFEEAEKNSPSIIFIDEIDAIAPKREEVKGEVERRVVAQLLAIMDGLKSRGEVVVIAATNVPNILDPALRRPGRFDREIEIGVPSKKGRNKVLQIHTRNMPLAKDVNLSEIAEITYGFVGADLESLSKEAAMIVLRRIIPDLSLEEDSSIPKDILEKLQITREDFFQALKTVRPSALREVLVEKPTTKWDDVGGLEDVKRDLKEAVEWPLKHPERFTRMGVRPPRGIMLYGAPGTGKTLLAKAVANESKANFILVKGPELLSKWVGESEKAVREIFKKARQTSPTIIFFDELDSLASRRGVNSSDGNATERVVNQLLTEIDGLEELHDVVVIAATNRPDMVDTALLRPGRFDRIILTPTPARMTRKKIFKIHTQGMPLKNVNLDRLAERTQGYVGADIEAVCREAAMLALREDSNAKDIKMKHFDEALNEVQPSVTKEIKKAYDELKGHFKSARAKEMKDRPSYLG
ncbi:MAG: CDC48 family AAA ATPase [Candidatus Woesearchaeota archaeon]